MNKLKKTKRLKEFKKNMYKGEAGSLFVVAILLLIFLFGLSFAGGQLPKIRPDKSGAPVIIITQTQQNPKDNLQLNTFSGATLTPSPTGSI